MLPFLTRTKLFKVEIFRSNLKNSLNIKKIFPQNTKKWPKYVRKMNSRGLFVLFGSFGESCRGEREIQFVSRRHPSNNPGELT